MVVVFSDWTANVEVTITSGLGLQTNLAGFWEYQNTSWLDSTGNGNTLTGHGSPARSTGTGIGFGAAITCDRTVPKWLGCASTNLDVGGHDFSTMSWINTNIDAFPNQQNRIISIGALTGGVAAFDVYVSFGFGVNFVVFEVADNNFHGAVLPATDVSPDGQWHMVCCTYTTATGGMTISVDGGSRQTNTFSFTPLQTTVASPFNIGNLADDSTPSNVSFNGSLGPQGLWIGRALSTGDEALLYNSGAGLTYAGMA